MKEAEMDNKPSYMDESVFQEKSGYKPSRNLQSILIGTPLETAESEHQTISKAIGLAVFASDALSSTAYSTQEMMFILAAAGTQAFGNVMPLTIAVVALLAILTISYEQTIHAYPTGGGAYIVSRDNLGHVPGETAAAALLTDYILTVAVSVSSGVSQITSAIPELYDYRVILGVTFVFLVMLINLRGVKESGTIFAVPTYFFLASMAIMIVVGLIRYLTGNLGVVINPPALDAGFGLTTISTFLILKAFASGTTALTGVEAISNGIMAFKEPRSQNAGRTLIMMSTILGTMLLGVAFLSRQVGVVPSELEANLSQVARTVYGSRGLPYYLTVSATMVILIMAANTAFADFPRLSALVSADGFLPRQFSYRGSRLVYSSGIIILAIAASLLIVVFQASVNRLIPLYAVGVFISFTLSQFGMAKRWHRIGKLKEDEVIEQHGSVQAYDKHWMLKMFLNGFGSLCTLVITFIFGITKFVDGAWFVLVLTPLLVLLFSAIHRHYRGIAHKLSLHDGEKSSAAIKHHRVLLLVSGVHQSSLRALRYARSISDDITAIHVATDPEEAEKVKRGWSEWGDGFRLQILDSPYRKLIEPLIEYINKLIVNQGPDEIITVVVPQFVSKSPTISVLHAKAANTLRDALIYYPNVVITEVPYDIDKL